MSSEKETRKTEIMAEIEKLVDQMLDDAPDRRSIHLRDIERLAVGVGEDIKQVIAQELSQTEAPKGVMCPDCEKPLHMKDYRTKHVVTEAGEITVKRPYYYCAECKVGHFPPR